MGETGKRARAHRGNDGNKNSQKRRATDRDDKGNDELVIYRILCPNKVIGSVIGKSGKVINAIRQETKAKVTVVDPFPGAKERVITIYCYVKEKEELEVDEEFVDRDPLCPAQDALLRVHSVISNAVASFGESEERENDKEECRILVPTSQSANIIGKAGATIKKLRSRTHASIKITPRDANDPTHSCAMEFDNFLLISGDQEAVKEALFAISAIMYKFTPKEVIPLDASVPEALPSMVIPSDVPIFPAGGYYPSMDPNIPSRSVPAGLSATPVTDIPGYSDAGNAWPPLYLSEYPVVSAFGSTSRSEELTVRVLCPSNKIGRVIGKGGSSIKTVRQVSGARVDVEDKKADRKECIITITSTESPDDLKSIAVEAVLLLQGKINEDDEDTVTVRLLVPSKVIGCVIGKGGSIINEIRKKTKADVRISKGEKPKCADSTDELVEVVGDVANVRDALIHIVLRLRDDVLKDRDGARKHSNDADSSYSGGTHLSIQPVLPSAAPGVHMGYDQRTEYGSSGYGSRFGMLPSSNVYEYGSLPMADNAYGALSSSYSANPYGSFPPPSSVDIVIPAHAVGKVLGKGASNIANIRKISGADVEISESRSSRGDRVAVISGTSEQRRSAENLIQAFIMMT